MNIIPSRSAPRLRSATFSITLSVAAISIMSFLIVYGITASCSIFAISLFVLLVLALPFLLLPAAILGVKAYLQFDPRRRLIFILLCLDGALLLALLTLLTT